MGEMRRSSMILMPILLAFLGASPLFADMPPTHFRPKTTAIPRSSVVKPGTLQPQRLPQEASRLCKDPKGYRQELERRAQDFSGQLNAWRKDNPQQTPEEFLKKSGFEKVANGRTDAKQIEMIKEQLIRAMRLCDDLQNREHRKGDPTR